MVLSPKPQLKLYGEVPRLDEAVNVIVWPVVGVAEL